MKFSDPKSLKIGNRWYVAVDIESMFGGYRAIVVAADTESQVWDAYEIYEISHSYR